MAVEPRPPRNWGAPIKEITAPDILRVLRAVALRGRFEWAKRLRATIGQVFRYGVATGPCRRRSDRCS